jgi:glycogenin
MDVDKKMKYTYISIITTNEYLEGVLVLYYSLMKTQPKYPFLLLVTPNVSQEILDKLFQHKINYKIVNYIQNATDFSSNEKSVRWKYTHSKLEIFGQTEFEKLVYLDADMLVLQNIDDLFEKPHMSAAIPSGLLPEYASKHTHLNSGLMVIEPSLDLYNDMMSKIRENATKYPGDQDFIQAYYPDWPSQKELHLDTKYHIFHSDLEQYNKLFGYQLNNSKNSVKVIHYIGSVKPWQKKQEISQLEFKMWLKEILQYIPKVKFKSGLYHKSLIAWLNYYRSIPNQNNRNPIRVENVRRLINQIIFGFAS